jgi:Flp pilus assembly protein TadD
MPEMSPEDLGFLITEGEAKLAAGDLDGALLVFQRAVAVASSSAVAHSKLGVVYVHKRQWDAAASEFGRAIQLDPTYAPAYSNLGNVCRERGQLDEAIAHYQKAVSMDPDYWIAHQNLGVVFKQQGRVGDAVREFKIATRLSLRAPGAGGGPVPVGGGRRAGCLGAAAMAIVGSFVLAAFHR